MALKNILLITSLFLANSICYCQEVGKVISTGSVSQTQSAKAIEYYDDALHNFEKKNYEKSIDLYKLAISSDTNFIDAYDNLGLAFRKLGKLDSAAYYYTYSFRKDTTNTTPIQNLAAIAELQNNFQKAKLFYLIITAMEPENPEGYYGLSRAESILGQNEDALKAGQLAEKYYKKIKSPYIGDCYYTLSVISYTLKDIATAKKYLALAKDAGVTIDPNLEKAINN